MPTIFIPLTFSLIAAVKGQYVAALANRALASEHDKIFNYQEQFFHWNDAFASAMVISSVTALTILAIGTIAFATVQMTSPYDLFFAILALLVCLVRACYSTSQAFGKRRPGHAVVNSVAREDGLFTFFITGLVGLFLVGVIAWIARPAMIGRWVKRDPLALIGGLGILFLVVTAVSPSVGRYFRKIQRRWRSREALPDLERSAKEAALDPARRSLIALALQWQVVFLVLAYAWNELREYKAWIPLREFPGPGEQAMHIQLLASFFAMQLAIPYVLDYFNVEYRALFPQSEDAKRALISAIPASDFENTPATGLESPLSKRQRHAPLLLRWTGAVVAFSLLNVFLTPEQYGVAGGVWMLCFALTVLLLAMVLIWWDLYQTWYPFSYLRQHERAPLSPAWKEIFLEQYTAADRKTTLSTGALLQLMTFDKFMYQYEDDDFTRLSQSEVQALFDCKPTGEFPSPKKPREQVLSGLPAGPLPVIYFGCGYAEWFPDFHEQLTAQQCQPEYIFVDAVTVPNSVTDEGEKGELWRKTTENRLTDLSFAPVHAETFSFLRNWAIRSAVATESPAERVLAISNSDDWFERSYNTVDKRDMFKGWKSGYTATQDAFEKCDEMFVNGDHPGNRLFQKIADPKSHQRPLIVLANNTYGQLIDPQPVACEEHKDGACLHSAPAMSLEKLSLQSRETFLKLLRKCFPSGFYLLLHGKIDFASSVSASSVTQSAPYTENWIQLMGTEWPRGVFLLGRWTRDEARREDIRQKHMPSGADVCQRIGQYISPSAMLPMFSRWLSTEKVLSELRVNLGSDLKVAVGELRRPMGANYVAFAEVGPPA